MESILSSHMSDTKSNFESSQAYPTENISDTNDQMIAFWSNERLSPILLAYNKEYVDGLTSLIEEQTLEIERINEENDKDLLFITILQTEVERIKFILRSYLRCRLGKIEAHYQHYHELLYSPRIPDQFAEHETTYLNNYKQLVEGHFSNAILNQLPQVLQTFPDDDEAFNRPSDDYGVFIKIIQDVGTYNFNDAEPFDLQMSVGNLFFIKFKHALELMDKGWARLI